MIPQQLHVVWLGTALPAWASRHLDLFTEHNPAWPVSIHNTWPPPGAPPELAAIGRRCTQYCQLADLIYVWLLATVGGVVMDLDSMTRRPFDPLCDHQAFSARHNNSDRRLTNETRASGEGSDQPPSLMLRLGRNRMAEYKLPLNQGNKHLYKVNGKVRLATADKAKELKDLGVSVTKVTKS